MLDQLLAGLNLAPTGTAGAGYGPVGTVVNGVLQRGSAHLRRNTTLTANLANGNLEAVANALVTLAPTGLRPLPTGLTGVQQRTLRNGCDRIAGGWRYVEETGNTPGVFTAGFNESNATPLRCFPEDYLQNNPQFNTATYTANLGHTNYHALQVQGSIRPTQGTSFQATYAWAKSMELLSSNGFGDPLQRDRDYQRGRQGPHSLRVNGTFELPLGPNKLLLANTSGWVARLLERWQTSFILNMATGSPADVIGAGNMRYGAARMNTTQYWKIPSGDVTWDRDLPNGQRAGDWYGNPSPYISVRDPQCFSPLVVQTDSMGFNFGAGCSLDALGLVVPEGTPDSFVVGDTSYLFALVNPTPGNFGDLGPRTLNYWGQFQLDANASKTFRLTENKSLQVRIDATNVLNHPTPGIPSFTIDTFGQINSKSGQRTLQGQLRLNF